MLNNLCAHRVWVSVFFPHGLFAYRRNHWTMNVDLSPWYENRSPCISDIVWMTGVQCTPVILTLYLIKKGNITHCAYFWNTQYYKSRLNIVESGFVVENIIGLITFRDVVVFVLFIPFTKKNRTKQRTTILQW